MSRSPTPRVRSSTAVLLGAALLVLWAGTVRADTAADRSHQRAALKAAAAAGAQHFRLLVIPVDFSDARLTAGATEGLAADLGEMVDFWEDASGGLLDLAPVLAPAVSLPGTRRDYSDVGLGGDLINSRAMAAAALTVTAARLPLHLADGDGPDGVPGTADDDGQVDGVLLLHAAPGLENDLDDGLIQPLQSYLLEPVASRGTLARRYAVASLRSDVGIWIHETGHLLGLEDRYDLNLSGGELGGEAVARGGLGLFSVMAAGWVEASPWRRLDAYSRLALGWVEPRRPPVGAAVLAPSPDAPVRLDLSTDPADPASYYLLETLPVADPAEGGATRPALIAYHVDTGVAEDGQSSSDPDDRHLRVRLVEADGDGAVAAGLDLGSVSDLWVPTGDEVLSWPEPEPPYGGSAGFRLDGVRRGPDGGILVDYHPLVNHWSVRPEFRIVAGDTLLDLHVDIEDSELLPESVAITVLDSGGLIEGLGDLTAPLEASPSGAGVFGLAWTPPPGLGTGDTSRLRVTVAPGGVPGLLTWAWGERTPTLADWPAGWTLADDGWVSGAAATMAPSAWPLPAALGPDAEPSAWPDLTTANSRTMEMLSPPWPAGTDVLLTHWYDLGPGPDGFQGDGAVVEAVLADGRRLRAVPRGGYPGRVDPASTTTLAGRPAFVGPGATDAAGVPVWRQDILPAPPSDAPFRLAFRQVTDGLWAGRGWWLGRLEAAAPGDSLRAAPARQGADWVWEATGPAEVQLSDDGHTWLTVAAPAAPRLPRSVVARALGEQGWSQARLRILAFEAGWLRATAPVLVVSDGAADPLRALAAWPNPAPDGCRIHLEVAAGVATLDLHDLRGRRLRRWELGPGDHILAWDGRDTVGRRLPAGRYLLRARAGATVLRRSVTLLP